MTVADPMTQAIVALCPHPQFVGGCAACVVRRDECRAHLHRLGDEILHGTEHS